jgi:fucokinase
MHPISATWDYLIVTASNERQAAAYRSQLEVRRQLGLLSGVEEFLVLPDPGGKRVGSGGSTIACLMEALSRVGATDRARWAEALARLRVLIIHAGGDSRRLPVYGPCGKLFVPVPGDSDSALADTLFDRQLPTYLALPAMPAGAGQVVITAGDVLLLFEPTDVHFAPTGVTGLGALAPPEQAAAHGVYCPTADGQVRLFLQKPTVQQQHEVGAVNRFGQSVLDIGVVNFDAATAVALLEMCDVATGPDATLQWTGLAAAAIEASGMDFYREICCAMGTEATAAHLVDWARASGSTWSDQLLEHTHAALVDVPFGLQLLPQCEFLHFGSTGQIITSGLDLLRRDRGVSRLGSCLDINNDMVEAGELIGADAWIEGCRVAAGLTLGGRNVLVGADVGEPLTLPAGACLDMTPGVGRDGREVSFVRCHGVGDTFKQTIAAGATLCNMPLGEWLAAVDASSADVWSDDVPAEQQTLWNARVFPAVADAGAYRPWLWMFDPETSSAEQRQAWLAADRYSTAEIAMLADQTAFHTRRSTIRSGEMRQSLRRMFRRDSEFSAADLTHALIDADAPAEAVVALLAEAQFYYGNDESAARPDSLTFSRIIHTLASAIEEMTGATDLPLSQVLPGLAEALPAAQQEWLKSVGLTITTDSRVRGWAADAKLAAFGHLSRAIISSGSKVALPVCTLRPDEIVWGRVPARLDLGGGWSDTPPYTLEFGGCVINAAVDLNGQPPIHVYARQIDEPVIRIGSIDLGSRIEITDLQGLLDYRQATGEFALAKAALAISGFSPEAADWPEAVTLADMLATFGSGIELTTLAAIPKGSGLGTSSIIGAVLLATVQRMMGKTLTHHELFHGVLRLEQALTTGGGWQDQVGGVVSGVKVATTAAGLIPDASIHYVPDDVLDPLTNGGVTLMYYTGITRLAKNILQQVVGRYLDRNRTAMATQRQIHALPPQVADAMARKDLAGFGACIDVAWRLNKQLDPDSSTPQIEALLDRLRPQLHGAKLLGAGGGGFLLLVCKDPAAAQQVREMLEADPPNERARFFDYSISREGLVVTVC